MSTDTDSTTTDESPENADWVEQHREQIEREANSDAPDAWVFERLLVGGDFDE